MVTVQYGSEPWEDVRGKAEQAMKEMDVDHEWSSSPPSSHPTLTYTFLSSSSSSSLSLSSAAADLPHPPVVLTFQAYASPLPVLSHPYLVCHAGAGTLIEGIAGRRRVLCVVNGSLMDNHQEEIAGAMDTVEGVTVHRPGRGAGQGGEEEARAFVEALGRAVRGPEAEGKSEGGARRFREALEEEIERGRGDEVEGCIVL